MNWMGNNNIAYDINYDTLSEVKSRKLLSLKEERVVEMEYFTICLLGVISISFGKVQWMCNGNSDLIGFSCR